MRQDETEVSDAMELLGQAIGSLRHDATVQILEQIVQEFAAEHINLHDLIL